MNDVWLNIQALRILLPNKNGGFGIADRNVRAAIAKGKFTVREASGSRGGKGGIRYEVLLSSLPEAAQKQYQKQQGQLAREALDGYAAAVEREDALAKILKQKQADAEAEKADAWKERQAALARWAGLPQLKKDRAQAREWLLLRCLSYRKEHALGVKAGTEAFVLEWRRGLVEAPAKFRPLLPTRHGHDSFSVPTALRWEAAYARHGVAGLVDGFGHRKGKSKLDAWPALQDLLAGWLEANPGADAHDLFAGAMAEMPELRGKVHARTAQRWIEAWKAKHIAGWTKHANPDGYKNTQMPAWGSYSENLTRPNELWEMDSTPADWMLKDGRHTVVGVIDVWTRRLKFIVSKTSSGLAVCRAFRLAALAWGVAEAIKTDNGADYVGNQFTGVLRALEIPHHICNPFSPEEKPHIERHIQTMLHGILELLPGFIGHNVAERQIIRARQSFAERMRKRDKGEAPGQREPVAVFMTGVELQAILDQWCEHIYAYAAHGGLDGKTPFQVASEWTGTLKRIDDERALDLLLYEVAGTRKVGKEGVTYQHHTYVDRGGDLIRYRDSSLTKEVTVKLDPEQLGYLYLYGEDGQFLCRAECPELTGWSRREAAAVAAAAEKEVLEKYREEKKARKKAVKKNLGQVLLDDAIARNSKLAALPRPAERYTTAGLEAAGEAARSQDAPKPDGGLVEQARAESRRLAGEAATVNVLGMDDGAKMAYWRRLDARLKAGGALDAAERKFHDGFQNSDFWKMVQEVERDLAPAEASKPA